MSAYLDSLAGKYAEIFIASFNGTDTSLWTKPWMNGGTAPQQNLDGNVYRGTNRISTMLRATHGGFRTNVWGTFLQWKDLGINVSKGEASTPICYYDLYVREKETGKRSSVTIDEYDRMSHEEREQRGLEKHCDTFNFNAFNADQTSLREKYPDAYEVLVKASAPADHSVDLAAVDAVAQRQAPWVCPVAIVEGREPSYHRGLGVVYTPPKEAYKTNRDYYASFFRSLAHSTGAKDVLDRPSLGETSLEGVAREELVCEFAAALCCNRVGLDATLARDNIQYMKIWTEKLGKEPKIIYSIIKDAVKASDKILSVMGFGKEQGLDARALLVPEVKVSEKKTETRKEKSERKRVNSMARGIKRS